MRRVRQSRVFARADNNRREVTFIVVFEKKQATINYDRGKRSLHSSLPFLLDVKYADATSRVKNYANGKYPRFPQTRQLMNDLSLSFSFSLSIVN